MFDPAPKSQQKLLTIKLTISVIEALIGYKISSWSIDSVDNGRTVATLHKKYHLFTEYLKKSTKPKKGDAKNKKDKDGNDTVFKKPGRNLTIKLPNTVLDFDIISRSVELLYKFV